jgi:histidinol dehydrogenase
VIGKADESGREDFMARLVARSVSHDSSLLADVAKILEEVRKRGDEALIVYAARFDGVQLNAFDLRVSLETLQRAADKLDGLVLAALREAIQNVRTFHERQREQSWMISHVHGTRVGQRITPIESVGLYVPGGTAAYPSSVVMNVVPAQVASVPRIVVVTPPSTVQLNPAVAAALLELGVHEVYAVGGAQAIAALAFGTNTIPRVDKITGPGNKYVAAAKKLVFGIVGIDSIAGPSEVVIVADDPARADFVAADLLAQAEHGDDASAVLITTSASLAANVVAAIEQQVSLLPRRTIIESSLNNYGAILVVENLSKACEVVNELSPEHLELLTGDNETVAEEIKHAGAIFLGPYSPEAVGDYFAGPNHVLPTGRTARFASPLGVYDFLKRTSIVEYSRGAMQNAAEKIGTLAEAEGLQGHATSARIRNSKG